MEQNSFDEGVSEQVDSARILASKELVVDFFGDNRSTWYAKLLQGGVKYSKTALESQDQYDGDMAENEDLDLPPLDPKRITEGRAANIVAFFEEYPEAKKDFFKYSA